MRNRIYMTASLVIRMSIGLIVFVLMARGLGPHAFGLVAAVFAYATIASLLTDFGFSIKTLRDIGERPDRGGTILISSLNVKFFLCTVVLLVGGLVIALLPVDGVYKLSGLFLGAGIVIASVGDLALTAFRATGRFGGETWITLWTSSIYLFLVGPVALLHGNILWVASAFFISRAVYAAVAVRGSLRLFPAYRFALQPVGKLLSTMQGAWAWAADIGLGYLNGQIDTILVVQLFGLSAAGIYQAGARFVQASLSLVTILSNVHIPTLASHIDLSNISKRERAIFFEFILFGTFIALSFLLGGKYLTKYVLSSSYAMVDTLWPGFSAFVLARYFAAVFGVVLTAFAAPRVRVVGQCFGLVVVLACFATFSSGRLSVIPWIMAAGAIATTTCYAIGRMLILYKSRRDKSKECQIQL